MHGLIHVILKDFILKKFGDSTWQEILRRGQIQDDVEILKMSQYEDALTFAFVDIACEVVDVPLEKAMELLGGFFVGYVIRAGFTKQLQSLGSNLTELISNLNLLHHNLERDYRSAVFPVFTVEVEGEANDVFLMKYETSRVGFETFIRGVLAEVADGLLKSDLTIEVLKSRKGRTSVSGNTYTEVIWRLHVHARPEGKSALKAEQVKDFGGSQWSFSFFDIHNAMTCFCSGDQSGARTITLNKFPGLYSRRAVELVLSKKTERINKIPNDNTPEHRMEIAKCLYRAVAADKVSAPWTDASALAEIRDFWVSYQKDDEYYSWSSDSGLFPGTKVLFLSHAWPSPEGWEETMGKDCSYGEVKATEACNIAKDIAALEFGDHSKWPAINFWLDKCCIPQGHPELMAQSVSLIEEFIKLSDGVVVMLSWSYFQRLWCVYEWVCFLMYKEPSKIILCVDAFLRRSTLQLIVHSIQHFSLKACQCVVESDRAILLKKVDSYYVSPEAFENFLKFSAIALLARNVAERAIVLGTQAMQPWQDLAKACNFHALEGRLQLLANQMAIWREETVDGSLSLDLQTIIAKKAAVWFEKEIVPLIDEQKLLAARDNCCLD